MLFSSVFLMMSLLCSWSVHLCANSVFCLHQWHRWRHEQHCVHSGRVRYHVSYWRRYKSSQRYHRNDVPARQLYSSHRLVGTCTTVKSGYTSAMLTKIWVDHKKGFSIFRRRLGGFKMGRVLHQATYISLNSAFFTNQHYILKSLLTSVHISVCF